MSQGNATQKRSPFKPVTRGSPCPVCGKPDWCRVSADGQVAACRRQELGCHHVRNYKDGGAAFVYYLSDARRAGGDHEAEAPARPSVPCADPDTLDRVYQAVLARLPLIGRHREDLLRRGMTAERIARGGYGTLPAGPRWGGLRGLRKQFGEPVLLSVPGVVRREKKQGGGHYLTLTGRPGLLIPVRDAKGKIRGLQIRVDEPDGGGKYKWLSSAGGDGPGPGAPAHCPLGVAPPCDVVRVTEGALKADLAFQLDGLPTVGVPGIGSVESALGLLRDLGAKAGRLAFDADRDVNKHVVGAVRRAAERILAEGHPLELELWEMVQGKGIDDLLHAGHRPRVLTGDEAKREAGVEMAEPHQDARNEEPQDPPPLALADSDPKQSIEQALLSHNLRAVAERALRVPGWMERYLVRLKNAGAKARDLEALRRAVSQQKKALRAERDRAAVSPPRACAVAGADVGLANYFEQESVTPDGKASVVKVGLPAQAIASRLAELSGGWPRRVDNLLFAEGPGHRPLWIEKPADLMGWAAGVLPADGPNRLRWAEGEDKVTQACFHAHLKQAAEACAAVETFPHHPPMPGHYYMHPPVEGGDGRALAWLLSRFCPGSDVDSHLLRAYFLTLFWGGECGARPAWLFTATEDDDRGGRGVGKSTVPKVATRMLGGAIAVDHDETISDVKTRILSAGGMAARMLLLDNLKTLKFSWGQLEALVTDPLISGHRMYLGEGKRPNTLNTVLTLNGAALSRDMAQRCVIVEMGRPEYSGTWEDETNAFVDEHRWAIVGDCLAALRADATPLREHGRWGTWEDGVLARVADPANCQAVIRERQESVDEDTAEADLVRDRFVGELVRNNFDPETCCVFFPSQRAAVILNDALGEKRPVSRACSYLKQLTVRGLRRGKSDGSRGFTWRGEKAPPSARAVRLPDVP